MPQLGETVSEGTITRWFKNVGDTVAVDEVLFEVSTDKVDTEVPSTSAGTLTEIKVAEGETVDVGTVLAIVGEGAPAAGGRRGAGSGSPTPPPPPAAPPQPPPAEAAAPAASTSAARTAGARRRLGTRCAPSAAGTDGKLLSPVVRRLITTYGIDANQIQGSGLGGRISRDDVQRYIEAHNLTAASEPTLGAGRPRAHRLLRQRRPPARRSPTAPGRQTDPPPSVEVCGTRHRDSAVQHPAQNR